MDCIDIPFDYAAPKRECIDRDSQRICDQIKGNLYRSNRLCLTNKTKSSFSSS